MLCCDCAYLGDKYSFPQPNNMIDIDPVNPAIKHYYCCCGDCDLYARDITGLGIEHCDYLEEV